MMLPLQITFRNIPSSEAIEASIRERAGKLDLFYDIITSCRVVVEVPHRHHKGKLYHVRVDITVPGGELVINRESTKRTAHEEVYVLIQKAFDTARRQLQDYARRQWGEVKGHEITPHSKLLPPAYCGREGSLPRGNRQRVVLLKEITDVEADLLFISKDREKRA